MKITAKELYKKLVDDYKIVGEIGSINFKIKDLSIVIKTKDSVGNLIQEWLKAWMNQNKIEFVENNNSQTFPDFLLDVENPKKGLLEVKTFDFDNGPGFDLANFDSYSNSLLSASYRLDSDYLIFAYQMNDGIITIKDIWLKKIWELTCASKKWPLRVQDKKNVIHNIRPVIWYSERSTYKAFNSKEEFLSALNNTRYKYPQTRFSNAHWLTNVIEDYELHTGVSLTIE
ncbi:type II restriction endonuclease NlaIV [Patiriisocius marinistellae]|uniref:Type II restriction endonuclease NlaIV n=1 Tax=Patiriisocius marinistellae TaxID=2494560 RepID=A0A5J4FYR4_9FLAO|nr:NgoBV family restriction endonuclease [Patiriisocius marinistellae]GEQ87430.1 type II restriction endonuclease NlaIV [Patiriisocius marinistellae]